MTTDRQLPEINIALTNPKDDVALLDAQTQLLLTSISMLSDEQVHEPSTLPGWSRGHVLAHIDGNAQGLARLARWARDGLERPMYISREVRDADVELASRRSQQVHLQAIRESANCFRRDFVELNTQQLAGEVTPGNGLRLVVRSLARHRLQEVCVHHHDLLVPGYGWHTWPEEMARHMTRLVARDFRQRETFPVGSVIIVTEQGGTEERLQITTDKSWILGTPRCVLAWLLGRSAGEGLDIAPGTAMPAAPSWR